MEFFFSDIHLEMASIHLGCHNEWSSHSYSECKCELVCTCVVCMNARSACVCVCCVVCMKQNKGFEGYLISNSCLTSYVIRWR